MKEASPCFIDVEIEREAYFAAYIVQIPKYGYRQISSLYMQLKKYLNSVSASVQTFKFENVS